MMAAEVIGADGSRAPVVPGAWVAPLCRLGAASFVLFLVFAADWAAMFRQWWDISTYNHMILVPLVEVWLVRSRRAELAQLSPRTWWPGLILFAGAAFVWLLGGISGLDLLRQAGVVGMFACLVPVLLGVRVTAALLFPLFYLVFLIPFGEELIKPLQMVTAEIAIALTHLSGVPAVIEGVFIDTPAGLFKVAEACSGVKFLIAMIAFGVLAANVCFVSVKRRAALLAACLVVPVIANGIRAWATIYAAQIFGIEAAAGFDHIVYGWIFFALVLALVIACAWPFFDRPVDGPMVSLDAIGNSPLLARLEGRGRRSVLALACILGVMVGIKLWAIFAASLAAPLPERIALPQVPGWHQVPYQPQVWWEPRAQGSDHRLLGRYEDTQGRKVDVFIALYARQGEGHEAGGFGQGALIPESAWAWQSGAPAFDGAEGIDMLADGRVPRRAMTWYRNGALFSGSNARLKLAVIANRLLFRAEPTGLLILSSADGNEQANAEALRAFRQATGSLDVWMDAVAAGS